jgi:hypothetical protein
LVAQPGSRAISIVKSRQGKCVCWNCHAISALPKAHFERCPEFDEVIATLGSPSFHDLALDVFFAALAAIDEEQPREAPGVPALISWQAEGRTMRKRKGNL